MFASKFLVFFIAALLVPSIAAPIWHGGSDTADLRARAPGKTDQVIQAIKNAFHPKKGEAVFWSGTRTGKGNKRVSVSRDAQKFARKEGKSTINQRLRQHGIKIPTPNQNKHSNSIWKKASEIWASRAHGDTHAILGGNVNPQSVYKTIEKPILMENDKVTKLTEHNMETGTKTVVKGGKP